MSSRPLPWLLPSLLLSLGTLAWADDDPQPQPAKPETPAATPAAAPEPTPPYTAEDLRKLYRPGLILRYGRRVLAKGKEQRFLVYQEVVDAGKAGYAISSLTFGPQGVALGNEPPKPRPMPYRVIPEMFSSAKRMQEGKIQVPAGSFPSVQYSYRVEVGGKPAWRHVWYSKQHPGLMLKSMLQPTGKIGRKSSITLELTQLPRQLGGEPLMGSAQGALPWSDFEISRRWAPKARAAWATKVEDPQAGARELVVEQTMLQHNAYCYVLRQRVLQGDQVKQDVARPQLWGNFLAKIRWADREQLEVSEEVEVQAAGKTWRCRAYRLRDGEVTLTYHLSLEVPGLTVRYESKGPKGGVLRELKSWEPAKSK